MMMGDGNLGGHNKAEIRAWIAATKLKIEAAKNEAEIKKKNDKRYREQMARVKSGESQRDFLEFIRKNTAAIRNKMIAAEKIRLTKNKE